MPWRLRTSSSSGSRARAHQAAAAAHAERTRSAPANAAEETRSCARQDSSHNNPYPPPAQHNTQQERFAAMLLRGDKTVELRRYAAPPRCLNRPVLLLATPDGAEGASTLPADVLPPDHPGVTVVRGVGVNCLLLCSHTSATVHTDSGTRLITTSNANHANNNHANRPAPSCSVSSGATRRLRSLPPTRRATASPPTALRPTGGSRARRGSCGGGSCGRAARGRRRRTAGTREGGRRCGGRSARGSKAKRMMNKQQQVVVRT